MVGHDDRVLKSTIVVNIDEVHVLNNDTNDKNTANVQNVNKNNEINMINHRLVNYELDIIINDHDQYERASPIPYPSR